MKIYKVFCHLSIVFNLFLFVSGATASNLYTIENVTVDVTADNAAQARKQAFEDAQTQAFTALAERLLTGDDLQNFTPPEGLALSTLIQDFEVTNERLSAVRYVGTYTFRFSSRAVQSFLFQRGVAHSNVEAKPLLILPAIERNGSTELWANDNLWLRAWSQAENSPGLVPFILPIGDIQDVRDIDSRNIFDYRASGLSNMLARYEASEALILVAELPADLNVPLRAGTSLNIHLYRTDRAQPEYVQTLPVRASSDQGWDDLFSVAVTRVRDTIRQDWKSRTSSNPTLRESLTVTTRFSSFQDWIAVQNALKQVSYLSAWNVLSVSPQHAELELSFQGTETRLQTALAQAGLSLRRTGGQPFNNQWDSINPYDTRPALPDATVAYELILISASSGVEPDIVPQASTGSMRF